MVTCICVDDSNRPSKIPVEKWVKKGNLYTIIFVTTVLPQDKLAIQLDEIILDDDCDPYAYFLAERFAIRREDTEAMIELMQMSDIMDSSIKDLIGQLNIEEQAV